MPAAIAGDCCSQRRSGFKPQRFHGSCEIINHIFPDTGGTQHCQLLGKAQYFANQASIHEPRGQAGSARSSLAQGGVIAINHPNVNPRQITLLIALFDLLPQLYGGLRFSLPNATPHSQAGLGFNRRTPPAFTPLFCGYSLVAFFLCPTYVHKPSI